jgi:ectoine hydroxylase-related dioxygenase (phytanoyl-CoA dioxygenase family)
MPFQYANSRGANARTFEHDARASEFNSASRTGDEQYSLDEVHRQDERRPQRHHVRRLGQRPAHRHDKLAEQGVGHNAGDARSCKRTGDSMDAYDEKRYWNDDHSNGAEENGSHGARHAVFAAEGRGSQVTDRSASSRREAITRRLNLDSSYREAYERDGFVKIKDVFDADVLAYYREHLAREVIRRNTNTAPLEERDTYHKAFLQVTNLWRTSDVAREFVFGKRLADLAAQLLGVQRVRLYHDQALYKEPGGGITPWHADQFYWPLSNEKTITAWVPLQATPLDMGPLAFAAGSHRMTFGRDLEISDESERSLREAVDSGRFREVNEPFELGEVSFHSGWAFHHTGANSSSTARAVMTVIYMADGIRLIEPMRKQHFLDWEAFMPGVQPGEVVDSPLNPVLN